MSILREAMKALRESEVEYFGEKALYRSRNGLEVDVSAVPGKTVFVQHNDFGTYVRIETRDFIIPKEDLADEPQKGEEIVFDGLIYEVSAPNDEPCWRWSDPLMTAYRVHTLLTGKET